jgi:hypothetical protein
VTDRLRNFAANLEKWKVVQMFPRVGRWKSGGLAKSFGDFMPYVEIIGKF